MNGLPFQFECPAAFFEKASAPPGQRRRIAGIISTEGRDRQREVVIQKGLDLNPFVENGWYNDNHSKDTDGVVGYPSQTRSFSKGQRLPNGGVADTNCTWAEGYLLEGHDRADRIWKLGQSLQKSGGNRRLGFSIEGSVQKRQGPGRRTIAQAVVRNVAITNCPVNIETRMETLAKSLIAVQQTSDDALTMFVKALTMGTATGPAVGPGTPTTGAGAGQVLAPESLETDERLKRRKRKKKFSKAEAFMWLQQKLPHASNETIGRILDTTTDLKQRGLL